MGDIRKQGIASSIFIYIGIAIGFVNVILLYPYIVGENILGFTRAVDEYTALFLLLGGFGTSLTTIRFFPHFRDKDEQHFGFLGFLFWVRTAGLLLSIVLIFLLKSTILSQIENPTTLHYIASYYFLIPIMLALSTYAEMLEFYAIGLMRPRVPVFFREIVVRLSTTFFLGLFYFGWIDERQFIYLFAIRFLTVLLGLLFFLWSIRELFFKSGFEVFKTPLFKKMANYSLYSLFSNLGSKISGKIDILMLTAMVNLKAVAIYVVMAYIARVVQVPHEGVAKIASPVFAQAWKDRDLEQIKAYYKSMALNNFAFGLIIYIGIIANFNNIFTILKPEYIDGKMVILFLGLSQLISVVNGYNGLVIIHSSKYRFDLYSKLITAVIAIISNYFLIRTYGLVGAAAATALTLVVANLVIQVFVYFHFKILPFSWEMLSVIVIGIITYLVGENMPSLHSHWVVDFIFRSIILCVIFFGGLLLTKATPEINQFIRNFQKKSPE